MCTISAVCLWHFAKGYKNNIMSDARLLNLLGCEGVSRFLLNFSQIVYKSNGWAWDKNWKFPLGLFYTLCTPARIVKRALFSQHNGQNSNEISRQMSLLIQLKSVKGCVSNIIDRKVSFCWKFISKKVQMWAPWLRMRFIHAALKMFQE